MAKENNKNSCWIGFDLGGTKMLATVYDNDLNRLGSERKRTRGHEGVEAGLKRMTSAIKDALADAGRELSDLRGIGVAAPGPLDLDKGIILEAPNLGWTNAKVKDTLEKTFDCPTVMANDVDSGVYGEYRFGAAKKARCAIGIFPGTGIGGGCVYDGRLLRGARGSCMEIGHVPVIPDGPLCGCGRYGCLEAVASRLAISAAASAAAYRGEAPHLREAAGTDLSNIRSGVLRSSIEAGDEAVEHIIRHAAHWVGYAAAGLVHLLTPDVIVLGGGLVEAMPDLYLEEVNDALEHQVMPSYLGTYKVKVAELGDDSTVKGMAAMVYDELNR